MIEKLTSASDKQAEKAVLSHCLLVEQLPVWFKEDLFTGDEKELARALLSQWNEIGDINKTILPDHCKRTARTCLNEPSDIDDRVRDHLKKKWRLRKVGRAIVEGVEKCDEDPDEAVEIIEEAASSAMVDFEEKEYNHKERVEKIARRYTEVVENDATKSIGDKCGVALIDYCLNGFQPGRTYAVGALKKTGKSRFMVWLACKMAALGRPIIINSLEMSEDDLNTATLSHLSNIDSTKFGKKLTPEESEKLIKASEVFSGYNWKIVKCRTIPELRAVVMHERALGNCAYCFIDFVQRMQSAKYHGDRVREVEEIAMGIADIGRDTGVTMVMLSQIQGIAEKLKPSKVPDMSHYKESQGIPENSDAILTLHDPNRKKDKPAVYSPSELKLRIEQRFGVSNVVVNLMGDLRTCDFYGIDKQHQEEEVDHAEGFRDG